MALAHPGFTVQDPTGAACKCDGDTALLEGRFDDAVAHYSAGLAALGITPQASKKKQVAEESHVAIECSPEASPKDRQGLAHVAIECSPPGPPPSAPPPPRPKTPPPMVAAEPPVKEGEMPAVAPEGASGQLSEDQEGLYALYNQRSTALSHLREFKYALSDAKQCIKMDPRNPRGHVRRAVALEGLRKNAQAVEAYKTACKLDPENAALKKRMTEATFRANASKYGYAGGRTF